MESRCPATATGTERSCACFVISQLRNARWRSKEFTGGMGVGGWSQGIKQENMKAKPMQDVARQQGIKKYTGSYTTERTMHCPPEQPRGP
eukprot:6203004-Pleurochrysis_carterae.AAC.3